MVTQFGRSEGIVFPGPGASTSVWERGHKFLSPLTLYTWFTDFQIFISISQSISFYGAPFVHSHMRFLHSLSLIQFRGISSLVLWRSHLHMEHQDHSSVKHQSCSRHWTGVPLSITTYYSYINAGFQQQPPHTNCTLPYARTTAVPRVRSKTPARKCIHCTNVCVEFLIMKLVFNVKCILCIITILAQISNVYSSRKPLQYQSEIISQEENYL